MRNHLVCLLVFGAGLGVACGGGRGELGGPQPPVDGPAAEGDVAVFRPLTAVISVSEVSSNLSAATTERMIVTVDVAPVDATTGTVPGLLVSMQNEPLAWTDAVPDAAFVPGETRRQHLLRELPAAAIPGDRVIRFDFDYQGARLRYDLAVIPRIEIVSPRGSVSAGLEELGVEWTPPLEIGSTRLELRTVHYEGDPSNPTTVSTCNLGYTLTHNEPARAVFTRTIAASGREPPCNGWASVAHRRSDTVASAFKSLVVQTYQMTIEHLTFARAP